MAALSDISTTPAAAMPTATTIASLISCLVAPTSSADTQRAQQRGEKCGDHLIVSQTKEQQQK